MKENFSNRYKRSKDKATLLKREIEALEMLFDEKKLPLWTNVFSNNRPIKYLHYTEGDIVQIREAYQNYIVNGTDIKEAGEYFYVKKESVNKDTDIYVIDTKGRYCKKFPPNSSQVHYYNEAVMLFEYLGWLKEFSDIKPKGKRQMSIPTKASKDQILDFWFRLTGNNEKGQPYWENEKEIEHFVNQNFEGFPGVDEKKEFTPNMNKSELNHVTWTFFNMYGMSKTKMQYKKLLMLNFTKFKDDKNVYSNIKDQNNEHLKKLFK